MGQLFCRDFQRIQPVAHDEQIIAAAKSIYTDSGQITDADLTNPEIVGIEAFTLIIHALLVEEISRYDSSSPKMNPVIFVNHLCTTYGVDRTSAVRRVQEVRAIKARKKF